MDLPLQARLFPGLTIKIQRSNGEGGVLRPKGPVGWRRNYRPSPNGRPESQILTPLV